MRKITSLSGFTLIELILVMSIFVTLVAFATPTLLGSRTSADINTTMSTVIADVKSQQLKAMLGDTGAGTESNPYGVHFETTSYTLFHGVTYSPTEPTNAVIELPGSTQFGDVNLPGRTLVFAKGSGEISGFVPGADSFTLIDPNSNVAREVIFNLYGVVTQAQ